MRHLSCQSTRGEGGPGGLYNRGLALTGKSEGWRGAASARAPFGTRVWECDGLPQPVGTRGTGGRSSRKGGSSSVGANGEPRAPLPVQDRFAQRMGGGRGLVNARRPCRACANNSPKPVGSPSFDPSSGRTDGDGRRLRKRGSPFVSAERHRRP